MRKDFLRKFNRSDEGQTLLLVAFGMMMLMLMAGLGIDVGYLHYQKQQMQKAADSAALAGAEALNSGDGKGSAQVAAQSDATVNGYLNGSNGITVTVNIPPRQSPNFANKDGYVEVIVAQNRPSFFMKVAGWGNVPVASHAVASVSSSGSGCIYALDDGDTNGALQINGNVRVGSSCGVYVDSTSSDALDINGNSGVMNAGTAGAGIGVVGPGDGTGWNPSGGPYCTGSGFCPQPVNIPHFADPLANVAAPPAPTQCNHTGWHNDTTTLNPGTYCDGITITGNGAYTFMPGLYTLCNGGMSVAGTAKLTGTGVTFYNTGHVNGVCNGNNYAPVSLNGTAGTKLTAPTSGSGCTAGAGGGCPGILVFQDRAYISTRSNDASSVNGTSGAIFSGALYFPGTDLKYAGTPNVDVASLIIAWRLTFSGDTTINNNLLLGGGSPLTTAALAE